jgi:hypothetical protein
MGVNEYLSQRVRKQLRAQLPNVPAELGNTLAQMVSGLWLGGLVQLWAMAVWVPAEIHLSSAVRRFERLLADERVEPARWFWPFVQAMQQSLGQETAYLIIDCTKAGRTCRTIVVGLAYHGTVLPVGWKTFTGKKGHLTGEKQREVLQLVYQHWRHWPRVVVLGDAEFSNERVIGYLREVHWHFIFRFQRNYQIRQTPEGEWHSMESLALACDLQPEHAYDWEGIWFTREHQLAELTVTVFLGQGQSEPWCLVSDLPASAELETLYPMRFWIEFFFAALKSRGFDLARTHLTQPEQIDRLFLVLAIATTWLLSLGTRLTLIGQTDLVDRTDRRDLSLFQLGWRYLCRLLALGKPVDLTRCFRWDLKLPNPGPQKAA